MHRLFIVYNLMVCKAWVDSSYLIWLVDWGVLDGAMVCDVLRAFLMMTDVVYYNMVMAGPCSSPDQSHTAFAVDQGWWIL